MRAVVENLSAKSILRNQDIVVLRDYIRKKNPGADLKERAAILADAVHKVIDRQIAEFKEEYRVEVRTNLLKKAVRENNFEIKAADVFKAFLTAEKLLEIDFLQALTQWINRQQHIQVTIETLSTFLNQKNKFQSVAEKPEVLVSKLGAWALKIKKITLLALEIITRARHKSIECKNRLAPYSKIFTKVLAASLVVCCLVVLQPISDIVTPSFGWPAGKIKETDKVPDNAANILPEEMRFKPVDIFKLQGYLLKRNSLLADEPYFTTILKIAEEFNINPLLLFAIAGQEQAFVPRNDVNAAKIANNPFNVHHSWWEYNTNIEDAARITAVTIINLSENRPEAVDPIFWINRKYSEDKNWWKGVRGIFEELKSEMR